MQNLRTVTMRVRNFQPRFAPLVKSGKKRQTMRLTPKRPCDMPKAGDVESWREWTGKPYRSKQNELIKVILLSVEKIWFTGDNILVGDQIIEWRPEEMEEFAQADGFKDLKDMNDWFEKNHGLPFEGILIKAKEFSDCRNSDTSPIRGDKLSTVEQIQLAGF